MPSVHKEAVKHGDMEDRSLTQRAVKIFGRLNAMIPQKTSCLPKTLRFVEFEGRRACGQS
jgi:hypothetical protein